LERRAFSLETGQWHQFPLFDEEVATHFAGFANAFELVAHEFALMVTDTLGESPFDVDGESFGTLHFCFHSCGCYWIFS